jgi:hypothetical protein
MTSERGGHRVSTIAGLAELWHETRGDPRVCIAVLDGPVDLSHPAIAGARLSVVELVAPIHDPSAGPALVHGTHVASLLFGQPGGPVEGVAPGCRGLVVPIFQGGAGFADLACSPLELARAMLLAVELGAHVINISGGQFSDDGIPHPLVADAVRRCVERGVLVVSAAGNDGCDCLHVPAALPGVLAVGAMSARGEPLGFSNWGDAYRSNGLLAPGEDLVGARPGGGTVALSGSSFATAVVSGVAALLMSLDLGRGLRPDGHRTGNHLLDNADLCVDDADTCRRHLAGRLNILRLLNRLRPEVRSMIDESRPSSAVELSTGPGLAPDPTTVSGTPQEPLQSDPSVRAVGPSAVTASACGCSECAGAANSSARPLVFALGRLGYDLVSEARRDSISRHMDGTMASINDPKQLVAHLKKHSYEAASITWTLLMDQTPVYAIAPSGPFAALGFDRLRSFLEEQNKGEIERVSIPGRIVGRTTLLNGQVVPTIDPELRGMYSWTTAALVEAVKAAVTSPPAGSAAPPVPPVTKFDDVRNFFDRVYFELRNLGITSEERAINYAATNAFQIGHVYASAIKENMELDAIEVERSPICRVDSDCWDVKLLFFYPDRQVQTVRRAYRFTVDVSDVVPVMVGPVRAWFVR